MCKYVATTMQRISMYSSSMHRELAKSMEMSGIEPEAFRVQNGGSTTELHPPPPVSSQQPNFTAHEKLSYILLHEMYKRNNQSFRPVNILFSTNSHAVSPCLGGGGGQSPSWIRRNWRHAAAFRELQCAEIYNKLTHSLTHTHTLTHSLTCSLAHRTRSLTHSQAHQLTDHVHSLTHKLTSSQNTFTH